MLREVQFHLVLQLPETKLNQINEYQILPQYLSLHAEKDVGMALLPTIHFSYYTLNNAICHLKTHLHLMVLDKF